MKLKNLPEQIIVIAGASPDAKSFADAPLFFFNQPDAYSSPARRERS